MAHVRQQIRDRIAANLGALATTGSNVYVSRVYPIANNRLPGLLLYTKSEETSYITMSLPRTQERMLTVTAECYVRAVDNYDDVLDNIAAEIETALFADPTLNGLARDVLVTSIETEFSNEGDQPLARSTMDINVIYITTEGSPTVAQ